MGLRVSGARRRPSSGWSFADTSVDGETEGWKGKDLLKVISHENRIRQTFQIQSLSPGA